MSRVGQGLLTLIVWMGSTTRELSFITEVPSIINLSRGPSQKYGWSQAWEKRKRREKGASHSYDCP